MKCSSWGQAAGPPSGGRRQSSLRCGLIGVRRSAAARPRLRWPVRARQQVWRRTWSPQRLATALVRPSALLGASAATARQAAEPTWRPHHPQVLAEYIYIADGRTAELCSTTVVLEGGRPEYADALPRIELATEAGEVFLTPRSIYADPLRGGAHVLVICEAYVPPQVSSRRRRTCAAAPRPGTART